MVTKLAIVFLGLLLAGCAAPATPPPDLEARIRRIENGLLLPVVVKGEGMRPMQLAERMEFFKTPGVSIAFINEGRIEWARAYGVREAGNPAPVTVVTLFSAGSISKPVTAIAARKLVALGRLDLDEVVNRKLISWKVPENEFTRAEKVTLRGLLSHRAGVNVPSFLGYLMGEPVPTLAQILDGAPPANTPPIRVDGPPGTFRYSGGGYTIVQQLLIDLERKPFPDLMGALVLDPLGMTHTTFAQPPFRDREAAAGHDAKGEMPPGKWRVLPELAAAGMWATPSDLALFAIDVQRTRGWDIGFFLDGEGRSRRFSHGGSTREFNAHLMAYTETGQGVVIMTNGVRGERLITEILRSIAREYGWSDFQPKERSIANVDRETLSDYAGRYQFDFSPDYVVTVSAGDGKLVTELKQPVSTTSSDVFPESKDRFFRRDADLDITFGRDATGRVTHLVFHQEGQEFRANRVGP